MDRKALCLRFWDRSPFFRTQSYKAYARGFLLQKIREDVGAGDKTAKALNVPDRLAQAKIFAWEQGIVAGIDEVSLLPEIRVTLHKRDGEAMVKGDVLLSLQGKLSTLLSYERTIVNCLQRMSGIATETNTLKQLVEGNCLILGTRKTIWGPMDKNALHVGGALTHRLGLHDGILIKKNYTKGLVDAIRIASKSAEFIEVEVDSKEAALQVAQAGLAVHVALLLDNISPAIIRDILASIKDSRILFEASGNITSANIKEYAATGVDAVSIGYLTHSPKSLNISMYID